MWYDKFNIQIPNGKFSGEVATICPECSHTRKKKTDKCLGVNLTTRVFKCNHCGFKGGAPADKPLVYEPKKVYDKPEWKNKTELSEAVVKYFESRKISQATLAKMKISEGVNFIPKQNASAKCIEFNYFYDGELYTAKYRDRLKNWAIPKNSELIPYNADAIKTELEENPTAATLYFVEGEMDCLSLIESGIKNVVSVPNGSNSNLDCFERFIPDLEKFQNFIIAVDNDEAGRKLKYNLAYRFGIERCKYVEFGNYKDANECLMAEGISSIIQFIADKKDFPIDGAFNISEFSASVHDIFLNELTQEDKIGIPEFDSKLSFKRGYITTITGIPNHGKSDFVDEIVLRLALRHNWKTAFFSPENKPEQMHIQKHVRRLIGTRTPTPEQVDMALEYLDRHFFIVNPPENFKLETILTTIKQLKFRNGIDAFVLDPWNKLEHKRENGETETEYIGRALDMLARFCYMNNVHLFLVAHPTKMQKDNDTKKITVPTLYNINGSANFYNKSDNGIIVYRNYDEDNSVLIDVAKIKFNHWGEGGETTLRYNGATGRYSNSVDTSPWVIKTGAKLDTNPQDVIKHREETPKQEKIKEIKNFYEPKSFLEEAEELDY